jgi:prohibitin 2
LSKSPALRLREWIDYHFVGLLTTFLVLMLVLFFCFPRIFITIPAGHAGALWLRFFGGTVLNFQFGEGTKIIFPWDKIYIYDMRIQQQSGTFDVLTSEGLQISVEATMRFRLKSNSLGAITAFAGPDFVQTLVMASVGAMVRMEAAKHTAEAIYSTERHTVEADIFTQMRKVVNDLIPQELHEGAEIVMLDFWFRSIKLPPELTKAIELKLAEREVAERYRYILEREGRESQRKRIEAEGIKAFQDTVSSGITDSYLRWKGIDATLKLAESPNAKVVVIGSGKEGLPIILGPWDNSQPLPPVKPGEKTGENLPAETPPRGSNAGHPSPPTIPTVAAPAPATLQPSSIGSTDSATRPSSASGAPPQSPVLPPMPTATQSNTQTIPPQQIR